MNAVYSINQGEFFDEDPEQLAYDYFDDNEIDEVTIFIGEEYKPTDSDEIEMMESEGWDYLIKKVRYFQLIKETLKTIG